MVSVNRGNFIILNHLLILLAGVGAIAGILIGSGCFAATNGAGAVDVAFVIDNSGSMRKNDPHFLTPKTVRTFLDQLPGTTRVAMVLFDQKARLLQPLSDLSDPASKKKLSDCLDKVDYRGKFTDSAAGIERAAYELKTGGRKEAGKSIIFLTDGIVDTGDRQKDIERTQWLKTDLTADCSASGIRILGIAFTENADFPLIQALASRTGGAYYRAIRAEEIADVLDRIQTLLPPPLPEPAAVEPDKAISPEPEAPRPEAEPSASAQPALTQAVVSEKEPTPVPEASRSSWKFYLPLVFIIFILMGLVAMLVFKLFSLPAWLGGRKNSPPPIPGMNLSAPPGWEIEDLSGNGKKIHRFDKARVTVGRDNKNDLIIVTTTVSNLHATIEYRDGTFFLEDQRSTNGTRLNDHQIKANTPVRLKSGDRISFANLEFQFVRLDQIVSGDTVMLEITTFDALPDEPVDGKFNASESEKSLRGCLEQHVDQIRLMGEKYNAFADAYLSDEMCAAISIQALENMDQTQADQDQHCSPLIKDSSFFVICTLPVTALSVAAWFGVHYGGFTRFISKWIRSAGYDVTACKQFCVVTFGMDPQPWVSMTVVPTHDDPDPVEIMSVNFLSNAEKRELGLKFDDHGRVL